MKAHGLLERIGRSYLYRLTDKGAKAALMFVLFHKRVCGPLANSLITGPMKSSSLPCQQSGSCLPQGRSGDSVHP